MLVECPHCSEDLEIELGQGSLFECPLCSLEFEFEPNPAIDADYSEHFWKLAMKWGNSGCLDYIERNDGELPNHRLIEIRSESGFEWGHVGLILWIITIPLLAIFFITYLVQNSAKEHQRFFWSHPTRYFFDPSEKAIISTAKYKTGWYPTKVSYLDGDLKISKRIITGEGQGHYFVLALNSKHDMRFEYRKKAELCREKILTLLKQ